MRRRIRHAFWWHVSHRWTVFQRTHWQQFCAVGWHPRRLRDGMCLYCGDGRTDALG